MELCVPVQTVILRLRRKDEVGECDGEYRHGRRRKRWRSSASVLRPLAYRSQAPTIRGRLLGASRAFSCRRLLAVLFTQRARERLVVAIIVAAGPDSLPAPRCRLPRPARAAIN